MTDRTAQIQARLDAASSQPWSRRSEKSWGDVSHRVDAASSMEVATTGYGPEGGTAHQDAELIAHAPDDLRYLLAENTRLVTELAELQAEHARCFGHMKGYAEAKMRALKRDYVASLALLMEHHRQADALEPSLETLKRQWEQAYKGMSNVNDAGAGMREYNAWKRYAAARDKKKETDR
jgi:hypothetical protein